MSLISGILTKDSPLRRVFPSGMIPLVRLGTERVLLGESQETEEVYFLAVKACTADQVRAMADMMAELGQGTREEAAEFLRTAREMPIRATTVAGASMPLRAFI